MHREALDMHPWGTEFTPGDNAKDKIAFHKFSRQNSMEFNPRPPRRNSKLPHVERKKKTIKIIIKPIYRDDQEANTRVVVARAVFLSNIFSEAKFLSSFELTKRYAPSLFGIPRKTYTQRTPRRLRVSIWPKSHTETTGNPHLRHSPDESDQTKIRHLDILFHTNPCKEKGLGLKEGSRNAGTMHNFRGIRTWHPNEGGL